MAGVVDRFVGAAAGGHERVLHAGEAADILRDALGEGGGGGQRSAFRVRHQDVVLRLIVLREEVLADEDEQRHDGEDHQRAEREHGFAVGHRPLQHVV